MLETFKHTVDYLSSPTISFSILTVVTPILFPPTDWFDKINRKLGFYLLWTKTGCAVALSVITFFFAVGYMDKNFSVILMKGENFPIVLMVYSIFFFRCNKCIVIFIDTIFFDTYFNRFIVIWV